MEKYQLYRTALDALQFLLSSDLDFSEEQKNVLRLCASIVCEDMKDILSVSHVSA